MIKKRKFLFKIMIIFFIVIVICTFLSKTIKNMLLPEVEIVKSKSGFLEYSINALGTIEYGENLKINAQDNWNIKEVLVRPGQAIEANTVLARIDMTDIKEMQEKKELEILGIEAEIKELKLAEKVDNNVLNIKNKELTIAKEEYDKISEGVNENGEIISPIKGKIKTIYYSSGDMVEYGATIFEISNNENSYNVAWTSSVSDSKYLHTNNNVSVIFEGIQSTVNVDATITSKKYDLEKDLYSYEATIDSSKLKNEFLDIGESVAVKYTFNQGKESSCIIPREAVTTDDSGNSIVYIVKERNTVFGKEKYVDPLRITILGSNDAEYSIENIGNDGNHIVLNVSDEIKSGDAVKIR